MSATASSAAALRAAAKMYCKIAWMYSTSNRPDATAAMPGHKKAAMDSEKFYLIMLNDGEVEEPDSGELLAAIRLEHLSYQTMPHFEHGAVAGPLRRRIQFHSGVRQALTHTDPGRAPRRQRAGDDGQHGDDDQPQGGPGRGELIGQLLVERKR